MVYIATRLIVIGQIIGPTAAGSTGTVLRPGW